MTVSALKPHIIPHCTASVAWTPYDVTWLPMTPKVVVVGQEAKGDGVVEVFDFSASGLASVSKVSSPTAIKCVRPGLSPRTIVTGGFTGSLSVWNMDKPSTPVYSVKAHDDIINAIDTAGSQDANYGPPEIVTASRDGCIKVWDVRVKEKPVAVIAPAAGQPKADAWAVAFGNSYNDTERVVCAGYDNGDVKLFDLRSMKLQWEHNVKNGVCGIEFDRKDIKMNKVVVTTLEGGIWAFDLRTFCEEKDQEAFTSVKKTLADATTVWTARHSPHNRDIFMTSGGNGTLHLWKYNYPSQRSQELKSGAHVGVPGTLEELNHASVAEQPVGSFSWCRDKLGLCAFTAFDQTVKIGIVTRLEQY